MVTREYDVVFCMHLWAVLMAHRKFCAQTRRNETFLSKTWYSNGLLISRWISCFLSFHIISVSLDYCYNLIILRNIDDFYIIGVWKTINHCAKSHFIHHLHYRQDFFLSSLNRNIIFVSLCMNQILNTSCVWGVRDALKLDL